jgi:hypothetical protein
MRSNFSLSLAILPLLFLLGPAMGAEPPVTGTFTANGKSAKLAFARAVKGEAFDGKDTTVLIFSEKDASKAAKPDFDAGFGKYGNSLTITILPDGKIIGCQIYHNAFSNKSFSSSGSIDTKDFKNEGGMLQGKFLTDGVQKFFEETWEVNLTFKVKAP